MSETNKIANVKKGINAGVINNILMIVFPFLSRTVIIYILGNEYLGLGNLFTSILNVLSLSELGFGAAIASILYKPIAYKEVDTVNAIMNFYRKCYKIIGIVILLAGLILMPFIRGLVQGEIPSDVNLYVLYLIYLFNTSISYFLFAYKKILLTVNQRYDVEMQISIITVSFQYIIQIILLLVIRNYYFYVFIIPISTLLNNILCNIKINKMFPQYACVGKLNKNLYQTILKQVGGVFCSKIGLTIYNSADQIIISAFLGLAILGQYGNYYYIITALISIFAVVHNTIRPIIGEKIVTSTKKDNFNGFMKINYIYSWIYICCCCCLLCLYQPFIRLWVGEINMLNSNMVILFVVYFASSRIYGILEVYQSAAGLWWQGKFIPLIASLVNIFINIYLVQRIGLEGILISSIISSVLIIFPGYIYILFRYYFNFRGALYQYIKSFIWGLINILCTCLVTYYICSFVSNSGIFSFLIKALLSVIVCNIVLVLLNFNNKYFRSSFELIKNMVKKSSINKKL